MNKHPSPNRDDGFTLLELLVAMALVSFLSFLLFASVQYGQRAWSTSQSALQTSASLRSAISTLQMELRLAYPKFTESGGSGHIEFEGDNTSITFLTPLQNMSGALARTNILLNRDADEKSLTEEIMPELGTKTYKSVLIDHIQTIKISYFGETPTKPTLEWQSTWKERSRLPRLVRFEIEFSDKTRGSQVVFTAQPRLSADVACALDAITKFCRGR